MRVIELTPDPDAYLQAVRRALSDLEAELRDDLLADVEAFLFEAASDREERVWQRLPTPSRFAAELRDAAGFAEPQTPRWFARALLVGAGVGVAFALTLALVPVGIDALRTDETSRTTGGVSSRPGHSSVIVRGVRPEAAFTVYYRRPGLVGLLVDNG